MKEGWHIRNRNAAGSPARRRRRPRRWLRILLAVLGALALLTFAALYRGLVTRQYRVESEKLLGAEPIRIIMLADLHGYVYGGDQQPLIRRVKALRPDVICLVGDMAETAGQLIGVTLLVEGIRDIAPCVYVTGNHEWWGDIDRVLGTFEDLGVPARRNEVVELAIKGRALRFYCLDDPFYTRPWDYGGLMAWIPSLDPGAYNILLSHRPDPAETYARYGFDLALSGHAHGGQARVPLLINGLYAPDQGWLPRYAGGRYRVADMDFIVSRGLSHYPGLPRVFNPPEVVMIEIAAGR